MSKGGIPKFRLVSEYDYNNRYQCLQCKTFFDTAEGKIFENGWQCCPYCGVAWEGEFTKRNPRYTGGYCGKFKTNLEFVVESQNHKPYGLHFFDNLWFLKSYTRLWSYLEYSSAAKLIWKEYKQLIDNNPNSNIRLVLSNLSHTHYKVLYQHHG